MGIDVDKWIEIAKKCKYLPENDLKQLCDLVSSILIEEGNIVSVSSPVTICGDIHGQFYDLEYLFTLTGHLPDTNYVFLGDYVDRGYYSLETLTLLLSLKVKYPNKITLLRGNHECRSTSQHYGFYEECRLKYGNSIPWKYICNVFDLLNIAALIDNDMLCIHGGLSPKIFKLDQIRTIDRNQEIPLQGAFSDLVWSDPDLDIETWKKSPRGAGYVFGKKVVSKFLELNNLDIICRAHQLVDEGIQFIFNDTLITIWSAPNYCYRCGNKASVLEVKNNEYIVHYFDAVPSEKRKVPPSFFTPYFL